MDRINAWPVLLALAVLWLAMLLLGGGEADAALLQATHVSGGAGLTVAVLITSLGDWQVLLAATFFGIAWLLYRRRSRDALLLLAVTLTGRVMIGVQKAVLGRVRPDEEGQLVEVYGMAFPSGHSANSMIVFLMLALLLTEPGPRRRAAVAAAVAASLLVGASRVPLAVHWPSDVVGGWAFGLLWVLLALRLPQTLKRNSSTSPS